VVLFENVQAWRYGYPNDEGLAEHPLWGQGLTFYNFHSIPSSFAKTATCIATFHDGTFQISADCARVAVQRHSNVRPWEALQALLGEGNNRILDDEDA
jgi:hypothetical protein